MNIFCRVFIIVAIVPFLLGPLAVQAKDDPKHIEQAKACTKECGSKHGTGTAKSKEKYDQQAYESCMNTCMNEPKQASSSSKK